MVFLCCAYSTVLGGVWLPSAEILGFADLLPLGAWEL